MMENRSFDHYLGWLPGADGKQAGLTYVDRDGVAARTHHLTDYQGCAHPDPDHSFEGGRVQSTAAAATAGCARARTTSSRSATTSRATSGSTATRRRTGRPSTATSRPPWPRPTRTASTSTARRPTGSTTRPTSPRCRRSGTGWPRPRASRARYYYVDVPFLALYGTKYLDIARTCAQFLADAAAGTLPAVSFLDPKFLDEGSGTLGRRPPARRHPRRAVVPQPGLRGGHAAARAGRAPRWSSTTTSGAASSTTSPPTRAPDADPGGRHRHARVPHARR